ALIPYQRPPGGELGENFRELGENFRELGEKCCQGNFSQAREMDLALARETGRKIIFTLFEFHEKIGKLSPNDRKKIEKQITPSFDRNSQVDYPTHIGDLKEKQLEEYLKLVIRKIHSIWVNILPELVGVKNQFQTEIAATTCLPEVVHVFLSKKDLLAKREKQLLDTRKKELTNARKNAWSWINRDLEQVREAGLNLAISWNQKSLDRAQEISKIEEQVDEIHKIIFHQVLSGIEENLLLLREVLGEPQFKSWSSQTKAARSLTELLQVYKNFASGRENYLSYKKILLDTLKRAKQANQQTSRSELESLGLVLKFIKDLLIEKLLTESQKTIDEKIKNSEIYLDYCNIPEEPKVEEFLADRDTTFGQINQLLEEIKGIDNITPWTKLQQLKNKFDSYLYGERAEERDKFSSRVLSGENNSPYVVNWQYKLENQIQLYQQKERDLIAVLNSELARACCNPQTSWQEARHEVNQYLTAFRDLKKMLQGAASAVKSKNRNEQNSHRIRKTLARIKLKKLLEKGNFNEVSQSADEIRKLMAELNKREFVNEEEKASEIDGSLLLLGTLLVFHDELDELLTKDSEDPDQLRKIIILISKITTRIDEIKAKIAAKEQVQREEEINQKKTYWQNQLNNLLNKQKEVISDPSQIKLLQQSLILKQFTDDENGVIQKEIWSSHENQSLIQNACRELQNYYDVFSELNQILAREGNDYEELENLKKELNNKNSEIENQIERLQKTAVEPDQSFEEKLIINPIPKVQSVAVIKEIVNEGTEVCQGPAPKTIVKVEKEIAIVEQMP
ncbi:6584_t:CDS:10, partial [Gigaspora margarita]